MKPPHAVIPAVLHPAGAVVPTDVIGQLVDALTLEKRLLDELIAIMRRQRAAVAADDLQSVDDSTYSTQRVLVTLAEARRKRHALNRLLGGADTLEIQRLEQVLGARMTEPLRQARDELQAAALALSGEVEINRQVLRQALATGDDYVRAVYGAPEPRQLYAGGNGQGGGAGSGTPRQGGILINRQV